MNIAKFQRHLFWRSSAYGCFWLGIQKPFVFSFSKNVFYPNQIFFCLDFSLFSLRGFDDILKKAFLNFLFRSMFYQYHQYTFYMQLGSSTSPQSYLYFKISRAQICLTGAQYFNLINKFWVYSSDFSAFVIDILYTVCQRSKQFLWSS